MAPLLACLWVASVGGGAYVAVQKRRHWSEGAAFGVLFGPLGMLTVACLPLGERMPERQYRGIADRQPELIRQPSR